MDPPKKNVDIMNLFAALVLKDREREQIDLNQKEKIYRKIYLKILNTNQIDLK